VAEENVMHIMGVELSESDVRALDAMFKHPGYVVCEKILEAVKTSHVEDAFGKNKVNDMSVFIHAQAAYLLTQDIMELPQEVEQRLAKIDEQKKLEKKT